MSTTSRAEWTWLGAAFAGALALYAQLFPPLIGEWARFPNLSFGFAIPFIAAYLIWARRADVASTAPMPSLWGLPVLVLGLGGLVVGVLGEESFLARLSFPVTLFGLVVFLAGGRIARQVWVGLAYLVFMVPLPWTTIREISYRSRLLDSYVSAEALRWLGIPVYRDGVMLSLPNMSLEVADVCGSIPAIAALFSLGVAYAFLTRRPTRVQLVLILATFPFAIASNIIRITLTALGVYSLGPWTLHTVYHQFNGTVNFLVTFLLLLALDRVLGRRADTVVP